MRRIWRRWLLGMGCCAVAIAAWAQLVQAEDTTEQAGTQAAAAGEVQAESIEGQFLSNVRQVTSGMVKAGEGYFSPDGETIVYQAVPLQYPFYQIYTQPLAGGEPHLVSTGRGRTTCAYFHPSEPRLIFASSHLDPQIEATEEAERQEQEEDRRTGRRRRYSWDFDPHMEIFQSDLSGHDLVRLTDAEGYDAEGGYSPDGSLIAFTSDRDGDPDIYVMNADGSDLRQVTNEPGYDGGPFISPDGEWIVYRTDRLKPEYLQVHVMRLDGSADTAITAGDSVNWGPYWHPTAPYIIWSGADHSRPGRPNYDLWMVRYEIDGDSFTVGPPMRVTDNPGADVLPVFSPDGTKLMWTSTRTDDGSSQLFIGDFTLPEE